jgi:hypothetical protein
MAFVTIAEARSAAATRGFTAASAQAELRKAANAPPSTEYDVFLSHSSEDAAVVAGVKALLEQDGVKVYVYWIEDGQSQRVTAATANNLRSRMQHCRALIYASSQASPKSKWMPWELGYFDGHKPGRIAIFPLAGGIAGSSFVGQEYLALYPNVERISWQDGRRGLGIATGSRTADPLGTFIRNGVRL